MRTRTTGATLLAGLALAGLVGTAHAQDAAKAPGAKKPAATVAPAKTTPRVKSAAEDDAAGSARTEAVRSVPKWQSFGTGDQPESLEETFFRLAQDFVATSEIGVRRLGRVPLWPRGNLKLGSFRVLPYVRQGAEWETNVFRRPNTDRFDDGEFNDGRKHGYSWVTNGGLLADTMLMGGRMRLAFSVDGQWEVRSRDDQSDTRETNAQAGVSYRWPSGITASGGIIYERLEDPIEIQDTSEFKRTNYRGFWNVSFERDVFFGSKVQLDVGMNMRDVNARQEDDLDRNDRTDVEYFVKASYPFWKESTRVFARARYKNSEREEKSINDGYVFGMDYGIEGDFPILGGETRGLRGSVSVGFDHAEYDDKEFTDDKGRRFQRDDDDSDTSLAVRAALQYTMGPRTVIDLRALRTNQFSTFGNYQITDRVDLTAQHTIRPQLIGRVAFFGEHSDPSNNTPLTRTDSFDPAFSNGEPQRDISRWGAGAGLRYTLTDWTDLDMSYDYERRNAPDDRGYSNHRVTLGITFYLTALKPSAKAAPVR